jgi:hypothetical protein
MPATRFCALPNRTGRLPLSTNGYRRGSANDQIPASADCGRARHVSRDRLLGGRFRRPLHLLQSAQCCAAKPAGANIGLFRQRGRRGGSSSGIPPPDCGLSEQRSARDDHHRPPNTYLYLVLGGGEALRYGIGVGREGFTWSGTKTIERKAEWPDWTPPPEMIERQPYLPRFVAGGPGNPLGARAMYLSGSVYRTAPTPRPLSAVRSLPAASAWSMRT